MRFSLSLLLLAYHLRRILYAHRTNISRLLLPLLLVFLVVLLCFHIPFTAALHFIVALSCAWGIEMRMSFGAYVWRPSVHQMKLLSAARPQFSFSS